MKLTTSPPGQPALPPWLTELPAAARNPHRRGDRRWPVKDSAVGLWWTVVILAAYWGWSPTGRVDALVEEGGHWQ
ncbi:hypothetical protein [Nocardia sp. NPDC052112]|uniref:hypothetical protein n=1 Tax=Nocardia sp. NPDC052112 TaxID=3155646 RepID=UPI0034346A7A